MANQPSRPWFRLASLARPAPESLPNPSAQPARGQIRPAFRPVSRPILPTPQPQPPTSVSLPTSPVTKPLPSTFSAPTTPKPVPITATVEKSPVNKAMTIDRESVSSPVRIDSDAKKQTNIPSVAEQKTMVVKKYSTDKLDPTGMPNDGGNSNTDHENHGKQLEDHKEKKEKVHHKKILSDFEDGFRRVITISGENRGAFMEVIHADHHLPNKNNNPKNESRNEEQGKSQMKDKNRKGYKGMKWFSTNAFINSNVQGVNNSILYNSSFTAHDPGVHLTLSTESAGGGFHVKDGSNGQHD